MIREFDSADRTRPLGSVPATRRPLSTVLVSMAARPSGRIGGTLTGFVVILALLAPLLTAVDPFALVGSALSTPSASHWMGTDALGRDLLSGILFGARTSLAVAGAVSALALACGVLVGLISGYAGGWIDESLLRISELLQVLPRFFLVIVVVALAGPGIERFVLTLGLTSWPVLARVVRGEVLALREMDFVIAAKAGGASSARILWRSIMPHVLPSSLVVSGLLFGQVLLLEASLGFLGLGDPNVMSWGLLAGQAQPLLRVAWWLPLFPGLAITCAVLGVSLLTDALASSLSGR